MKKAALLLLVLQIIASVPITAQLKVYRVGYRSQNAYSTYLSMGNPAQLSKQQAEQIKKQKDGSSILMEILTVKNKVQFSKELDIRENDVFFFNMAKL
jgi:xylan 1,4-beta-xylosidase